LVGYAEALIAWAAIPQHNDFSTAPHPAALARRVDRNKLCLMPPWASTPSTNAVPLASGNVGVATSSEAEGANWTGAQALHHRHAEPLFGTHYITSLNITSLTRLQNSTD
jgi:hypothetical protein